MGRGGLGGVGWSGVGGWVGGWTWVGVFRLRDVPIALIFNSDCVRV